MVPLAAELVRGLEPTDVKRVQIYLPIADLPVNIFLILAMGLAVGFISGMFGIGGGFLMTPLLIFIGISPAVAVASVTSHIAASSLSGAISYWRRNARSISRSPACCSPAAFSAPRRASGCSRCCARSASSISPSACPTCSCSASSARLMVIESVRAIIRAGRASRSSSRRPGSHTWIHGLPFKLRFKRSRIYVSAIPVWAIGFIIGFIGAVMGIGGGFLLVPMLIYLLRVPTATVIGTSMVLTLVTMASATVMHAATNHLVDAVLALILMVGGVIGAQFGARAGQKMRGERLRLLLGLLVLAVGMRFALDLVVPPERSLFDPAAGERPMTRPRVARICCARSPRLPCSPPRAGRGRAAGRLAVQSSGDDHVELHRRRAGAVRRRRARRCVACRAAAATTSSSPSPDRARRW